MDLTNASAIVTGVAGGFGSATVRRIAQMGAKALTVRATRSPTYENAVKKLSEKRFEWGSRARIRLVFGRQNGPGGAPAGPHKATSWGSSGLFRQFLYQVDRGGGTEVYVLLPLW